MPSNFGGFISGGLQGMNTLGQIIGQTQDKERREEEERLKWVREKNQAMIGGASPDYLKRVGPTGLTGEQAIQYTQRDKREAAAKAAIDAKAQQEQLKKAAEQEKALRDREMQNEGTRVDRSMAARAGQEQGLTGPALAAYTMNPKIPEQDLQRYPGFPQKEKKAPADPLAANRKNAMSQINWEHNVNRPEVLAKYRQPAEAAVGTLEQYAGITPEMNPSYAQNEMNAKRAVWNREVRAEQKRLANAGLAQAKRGVEEQFPYGGTESIQPAAPPQTVPPPQQVVAPPQGPPTPDESGAAAAIEQQAAAIEAQNAAIMEQIQRMQQKLEAALSVR